MPNQCFTLLLLVVVFFFSFSPCADTFKKYSKQMILQMLLTEHSLTNLP